MSRYAPPTGGLVIARPNPLSCTPGASQGLSLLSDLHFGAAGQDLEGLEWDLEEARAHQDRILLGGDIFDLILPQDRRRYTPAQIDPELAGRGDLQNAALEKAVRILAPYADLIDGIGVGNHETAAEKATSADVVRLLLEALGRDRCPSLPPIQYLGYTAYISYALVAGGRKKGHWVIWYHHGSRGGSTPQAAMSALAKKAKPFTADLYWSGHHHVRAHQAAIQHDCDGGTGRVRVKEVRHVLTGAYLTVHGIQGQDDYQARGRKSNWAADEGYGGGGVGVARVLLSWDKPGPPARVRVVQ